MNNIASDQWSIQMDKCADLFRAGQLSDAEQLLKSLLANNSQDVLTGLQRAETLSKLVLVLTKENNLNDAQICLQEAINILQQDGLKENPLFLTLLLQNLNIVRILPDKNNYRETLKATLKVFSKTLGSDHANTQALEKELNQIPEQQANSNNSSLSNSQKRQNTECVRPSENEEMVAVKKASIITPAQELDSYILKREKAYKNISLTIGIIGYLILLCALNIGVIISLPLIILFSYILNGLFCGKIRCHSIRVSAEQLPEINEMVESICSKLDMPVPAVYVSNGEGILNAFATRLLSKDFVILYSNILEMAYEKGQDEVAFVVAHELAHIKRGHTKRQFMYLPAKIVPFLENAYSRSRESTCDRIAAAMCPNGAKWGLVALAAGAKIYRRIDLQSLYKQFDEEHGFWTWFAEILSTHPSLVRRIKACGLAADETSVNEIQASQPKASAKLSSRLLPNFVK